MPRHVFETITKTKKGQQVFSIAVTSEAERSKSEYANFVFYHQGTKALRHRSKNVGIKSKTVYNICSSIFGCVWRSIFKSVPGANQLHVVSEVRVIAIAKKFQQFLTQSEPHRKILNNIIKTAFSKTLKGS